MAKITVITIDGYVLSNDLDSIDSTTFTKEQKEDILSIQIGDGIKEIGDYAFDGCTFLKGVILPKSVKKIGKGAFNNCPNLKMVKNRE